MAPVEGRNVRTNTMFSAILAVLFAIKSLDLSSKFLAFETRCQVAIVDVAAWASNLSKF